MINWFKSVFEDTEIGKVKVSRGKKHKFLGMNFEFTKDGKVCVKMEEYIQDMIDSFPDKVLKKATTPAAAHLFQVRDTVKLDEEQAGKYHTIVAKGLFLCQRARPDIQTAIAFLSTRVKGPDQDDWKKLQRLIFYLNGTRTLPLILETNNLNIVKWFVDASHHVHPDFRSHTGATMTMGRGGLYNRSLKQKINTRSSTESELVAVDDIMPLILWTNNFLEAQGFKTNNTIIYQDNKSAILLEKNGKLSSSKRTRHIEARYFFIKDCQDKGKVEVQYCPTDDMVADYFTKPLQGSKFSTFRRMIMNDE